MKKAFFTLLLVACSCVVFAAGEKKDKFNHSFNFCISNLNDCVTETPKTVTINLTKDPETLYDMCTVKMDGKTLSFRVISGIVRDKVYPDLSLIEMDAIPTTKKWALKFLGDRVKLYRLGGVRYEFKNVEIGETLGSVASDGDLQE